MVLSIFVSNFAFPNFVFYKNKPAFENGREDMPRCGAVSISSSDKMVFGNRHGTDREVVLRKYIRVILVDFLEL